MEELTNRLQLEKAIMLALIDVYFNFFNRLSLLVVGLNKTNVEDMRRRVSVYIDGCDDKLEREKHHSPYRYTKQNTSIHSPKLSSAYKSRLVSPKRVRQFQTDVLREESIGIYYTHQHITSREGSDITEEYMKCKRRCQELEAINESNTAEIALFREKNQNLLDLLKESSDCRPNGNSYIHEGNQQTQSICASLSNEIRRLTEENTQYEVIINKLQRKLCESNHVSAIQAEHRIEIMKWKNFVSELEADVIKAEYAAERSQGQLRLLSRQLKDIGAR